MDNHSDGRNVDPALPRRAGALLDAASEAVRGVANQALRPFGFGVRHFGLLTFLAHESAEEADDRVHEVLAGGPPSGAAVLSQQAICGALRIDRTTMVSLIDDLEHMGLVRRQRNPADRRAHMIRLTSRGAELQRRAEAALNAEAEAFFTPLSSEELAVLRDLLMRLVEHSRSR
jgi:DNA-binding MarR family transcriptional regulator